MNPDDFDKYIKMPIIEVLFDLHDRNMLNSHVVRSFSKHFEIDAEELCEEHGITYNLE